MKKLLKKITTITIVESMLLTSVSCGKPKEKVVKEPSEQEVQTEQLKVSKFDKSHLREYWYCNQDTEELYKKLMEDLNPVEDKFNSLKTHQVYVDNNGKEFIINGVTQVKLEEAENMEWIFLERTGELVRYFNTLKDKEYFVGVDRVTPQYFNGERDLMIEKETRNTIINGETIETPEDLIIKIGDGVDEEAVDFKFINKYVGVDYELNLEYKDNCFVEIATSPMKATSETVIIPVTIDEFKIIETEKSEHWSAKYDTKTQKLYIPKTVIQNLIGWDIVVCFENKVLALVTDSVYGVADGEVNLVGGYIGEEYGTEEETVMYNEPPTVLLNQKLNIIA